MAVNGAHRGLSRADEVDDLVNAVKDLIVPFVRDADEAAPLKARGNSTTDVNGQVKNVLVGQVSPGALLKQLSLDLPETGQGKHGLLQLVEKMLQYSVNTWDQGFLDKLYASNNAVGIVADMLLSALNTNIHVYQVAPALTVVEKVTARKLANLFGFASPTAGGIVCQGGSSSNMTSLVVARNTLFPSTRTDGNGPHRFALFTSAHGHYSVEKSALACGMGRSAVVAVPVNAEGRMVPEALRRAVLDARSGGKTPLYVNATAGTTVLGSFDPFPEIADICEEFGLWMHVDASWGGPVAFSDHQRPKLDGSERANSLTVNPHKMMNVPVTCSFLLTDNLAVFHRANSLPAGYLFHGADEDEIWDLADLTLQCGRRGDALKLALAWTYYGSSGFASQIDGAFAVAGRLASEVDGHPDFRLVSSCPPPCLQVCFYWAPGGVLDEDDAAGNSRQTAHMVRQLVGRGFMVDHAPGDYGNFFRVVVNCQTLKGTVVGLVKALEEVGRSTSF